MLRIFEALSHYENEKQDRTRSDDRRAHAWVLIRPIANCTANPRAATQEQAAENRIVYSVQIRRRVLPDEFDWRMFVREYNDDIASKGL